ncbi:uncharacterized protein MCYG_01970 [Microsporum canis CBS 113480]|uniref:Uncharacterized protein n=1 Tax=Arthroderma otae (strain ATCC MYA-4605 / CBS 113480) TaxID=554155 RepID=C5FIR0_ARTOC|nr:uncharacterized protein MCYG_01970 [Microsporum canis CBS 113480]EEQ29151.1 predicted protein [Microsporum canis CBS 113480]
MAVKVGPEEGMRYDDVMRVEVEVVVEEAVEEAEEDHLVCRVEVLLLVVAKVASRPSSPSRIKVDPVVTDISSSIDCPTVFVSCLMLPTHSSIEYQQGLNVNSQ